MSSHPLLVCGGEAASAYFWLSYNSIGANGAKRGQEPPCPALIYSSVLLGEGRWRKAKCHQQILKASCCTRNCILYTPQCLDWWGNLWTAAVKRCSITKSISIELGFNCTHPAWVHSMLTPTHEITKTAWPEAYSRSVHNSGLAGKLISGSVSRGK